MGVPLSVLLASLMAFGNMSERLELLSIKAAGVSLLRIMTPAIILVVTISLSMLHFNNAVFPDVYRKMRVLMWDVKRAKPELAFRNNVFNSEVVGFTVRIGDKNTENGMLKDVLIYDTRDIDAVMVTMADSGTMKTTEDEKFIVLTLYHGKTYGEIRDTKKKQAQNNSPEPFRRDTFEIQTVLIDLAQNFSRSNDESAKNHFFSKNFTELRYTVDSLDKFEDKKSQDFYQYKARYHYKLEESGVAFLPEMAVDRTHVLKENFDSVFVTMGKDQQISALNLSISGVRRVKNDILERSKESESILFQSRRHLYELHRKYSLAFLSLLLFFIGAPLGSIVRKGGLGLPVVISVLFFIAYYVVDNIGKHSTIDGGRAAWYGAWLSTMVLLPIGVFLTRQATTDSVLMNIENYMMIFKRYTTKKYKTKKNGERNSS
jgi:lipopolysaccharide export system permease protein